LTPPPRPAENLPLPIRLATPADLAAILALAQSAPTAAHWSPDQHRAALSDPSRLTLIIEENSQAAGFLVARSIDAEWELEDIVVTASAQRRGLGTQLLNEFLNLARHAQSIFLEVRESNLPARRLYEKHGFAQSGRRTNYYHSPAEAAIVYRLILSEPA
jgi:[ribosomal protein S18]-alanine N-acetyltransferase